MGMDNGLSVADAIALRDDNGNNNGFGDGNGWWIMFLFFLLAWGGNGWNNGYNGGGAGMQGALTRGDLCMDMNFSDLEAGVRGLQQGLCDGFYSMNTSMLNGFHGVDNAICNLGYTVQNGFNATQVAMMQGQNALQTQLADCCCTTQRAIDGVNYNMATNTCNIMNAMNTNTRDIIDSQNAGTRAILDYLCQDKISNLQNEVQTLRLAASQADQNNFIAANQQAQTAELIRRLGADCPQPAYVVQPPTQVSFPTNCCGQFNGWSRGNDCNNCGC